VPEFRLLVSRTSISVPEGTSTLPAAVCAEPRAPAAGVGDAAARQPL